MLHTLAFQMPSFPEMLIILAVGLLLFGKRLPEVGRSLGKGIVEFKKGLKGIEDEVDLSSDVRQATNVQTAPPQPTIAPPAHRFDPYTGKPIEQNAPQEQRVGM